MNRTNITELNIDYQWAIQLTDIIETYVIRAIGVTGVLFNAFFLKVLFNKGLKHKLYDFMSQIKFLCNMIVS